MQSRYIINVAQMFHKRARHFFRVELADGQTKEEVREILSELKARFPESDNYQITISYWAASGRDVTEQFA